jgi:hypothetical protein
MTNTLEKRLRCAKDVLADAGVALTRQAAKLPGPVEQQLRELTTAAADVEHWVGMIDARGAARRVLDGLEHRADGDDKVPHGTALVKFQHVRLLSVEAYLSTTWALADSLTGAFGRIVCTPEAGLNATKPPQLVSHFISTDRKKGVPNMLYGSMRATFGWPVGLFYATRNHFLHEGGHLRTANFFDGPTAASGFAVSAVGWTRVDERARTFGVDSTHHRLGPGWGSSAPADLRPFLDECERETDDALGVLVGSACRSLAAHVGFVVGED